MDLLLVLPGLDSDSPVGKTNGKMVVEESRAEISGS
jgi:hypothetical protein